jgi:hypothetical protein
MPFGFEFCQNLLGAPFGPEHRHIQQLQRKKRGQDVTIRLVVMIHDNGHGTVIRRQMLGHLMGARRDDAMSLRKVFHPRNFRTAIDHQHLVSEIAGQTNHWRDIVAAAKKKQAQRRRKPLDQGTALSVLAHELSLPRGENFHRLPVKACPEYVHIIRAHDN